MTAFGAGLSKYLLLGFKMVFDQIVLNFGGGNSAKFAYRKDSHADVGVIRQIFEHKSYDISRLRRYDDIVAQYTCILNAGHRPLIIDCGANIGASATWFSLCFPQAHIVALEPEPGNYEILRINSRDYSNIAIERAAISCTEETLYIEDPGEGNWGFRMTREACAGQAPVAAISIDSILGRERGAELFLVKIDIEGGEDRLFERNFEWIGQAALILVELHDWLMPRTACSRNCLKALSSYNRDFVVIGENVFSIRNL